MELGLQQNWIERRLTAGPRDRHLRRAWKLVTRLWPDIEGSQAAKKGCGDITASVPNKTLFQLDDNVRLKLDRARTIVKAARENDVLCKLAVVEPHKLTRVAASNERFVAN